MKVIIPGGTGHLGTILSTESREGYVPYGEIYVRSNVGSDEP